MSDSPQCHCRCKDYTITFLAFWFVVAPAACDSPGKLRALEKRLAAVEQACQAEPPAEAPR